MIISSMRIMTSSLIYNNSLVLVYLAFKSFDFERHLMKVIPETGRAH